ncbi:MAG: polysaccharide deacetylase family protein, partial [Acidimicrobiia bacterium]
MEVTVANFRRQLSWLQTRYEVVDLATAISRWHDSDSDRLVVLTFDDGYRDTRTVAYPLLLEREMPFTLYIATQQVEAATRSSGSTDGSSLAWSDIAEMDSSKLLTIGAHTHTHKDLRY